MKTENLIKKLWISLVIFITVLSILLLFLVYYAFPSEHLAEKSTTLTFFYGIAVLTLIVGIILLIGYTIWHWFVVIKNAQKQEEKEAENAFKFKQLTLLNGDALERRAIEHKRNIINDLFRLIELAKEKREKSESIPNGEKPDKFLLRTIDKSDDIDLKKLDTLMQYYSNMTNNKPNV